MAIYRVERGVVGEDEWRLVKAEVLSDGRHVVEQLGLQVPIAVEGDEVTVYVDEVAGTLDEGYVCGADNYENSTFDQLRMRRGLRALVLRPLDGTSVVHLFGDEELPSVLIERHDRPPTVHRERGG